MKIYITFNQNELIEHFKETEIFEHKTRFSYVKILNDLEQEIVNNYFRNRDVKDSYLIDYDTTGDRHCVFNLKNKKFADNGDCELNYEYDFIIS